MRFRTRIYRRFQLQGDRPLWDSSNYTPSKIALAELKD